MLAIPSGQSALHAEPDKVETSQVWELHTASSWPSRPVLASNDDSRASPTIKAFKCHGERLPCIASRVPLQLQIQHTVYVWCLRDGCRLQLQEEVRKTEKGHLEFEMHTSASDSAGAT